MLYNISVSFAFKFKINLLCISFCFATNKFRNNINLNYYEKVLLTFCYDGSVMHGM
jgi:hypothetical protein